VASAVKMLKRAKYMAERAYRPNHLLLDSINSNLAMAMMARDPESACSLAASCARTGDALVKETYYTSKRDLLYK
jgi:hypothetical protein